MGVAALAAVLLASVPVAAAPTSEIMISISAVDATRPVSECFSYIYSNKSLDEWGVVHDRHVLPLLCFLIFPLQISCTVSIPLFSAGGNRRFRV
jgi:hypothetical protein